MPLTKLTWRNEWSDTATITSHRPSADVSCARFVSSGKYNPAYLSKFLTLHRVPLKYTFTLSPVVAVQSYVRRSNNLNTSSVNDFILNRL